MEIGKSYDWDVKLRDIYRRINKRTYYSLLINVILLFIGMELCLLLLDWGNYLFYTYIFFPFVILSCLIGMYLIKRIKTEIYGNFFYIFMILLYDSLSIFGYFQTMGNIYFNPRLFYHYIFYSMMFLLIRFDITKKQYFHFIIYKLIQCVILFCFYNYNQVSKAKFTLLLDIFIVVACFGVIMINFNLKSFLIKKLKKLNFKNRSLTDRLKNIIDSMDIPLISINVKRNDIIYNKAFIKYIESNFIEENINFNFLLDHDKINHEMIEYFEQLSEEKKIFFNLKERDALEKKNQKKLAAYQNFKNKILFLDKIFQNYVEDEVNVPDQLNPQSFGLLNLFNGKIMELNKLFKLKNTEKIVKFNCRGTEFSEKEEVYDILLHDLTQTREIENVKADIKYRKIYLARIAHEFKTPINTMIYSINDIMSKFSNEISNSDFSIQLRKSFDFVEGQANFISVLINDINDYCKNVNDFEVKFDQVDVRSVIDFSFKTLTTLVQKDQYKKNNIDLQLKIDDEVPRTITTDERRLKQLLVNLISNSVKFTNFGYIKLTVTLESQTEEFIQIKFEVEDTGIGIKEEEQPKVFESFSKINKQYINLNKDGSGLGLSICKKIIEKIGKEIQFESKTNKTRFWFVINDYSSKKVTEINLTKTQSFYNTVPEKDLEETVLLNDHYPHILENENNNIVVEPILDEEKFIKVDSINTSFVNDRFKDDLSRAFNNINCNENSTFKAERRYKDLISSNNFKKEKKNYMKFSKSLFKFIKIVKENEGKVILICDDEKLNAKSLKKNLKKFFLEKNISNFKIIITSDAIESLNLLYFDALFCLRISTVFSDLHMKFVSGNTLFKIVEQSFPLVKFVLFSSDDSQIMNSKNRLKYSLKKPCSKEDICYLYSKMTDF